MNKNRLITNSKAAPRRRRLSRRPVRRRKYTFVADFCQHLLLVLVQQPKKELDWCSLMSISFFFSITITSFLIFSTPNLVPLPFIIPNFLYVLYFVYVCKEHLFINFCRTMYYPKKKPKKKTPKNLKPTQDFCFVYSSVNNFICLLIL